MNRVAVAVVLLALIGVASCGEDVGVVSKIDNISRAPKAPAWAKVAPEQIAEAKKHGVPVAFENDLGMRFVLILAGTFLMGSPEDEEGRDVNETQQQVTLDTPFYIQLAEVTNGQFRLWKAGHRSRGAGRPYGLTLDEELQPVVQVSWGNATDFAAWVSQRGDGRTYRLPREAEWEYACRAGTKGMFSWGHEVEDAWKFANGYDSPPTGYFRRHAFPVYDFHSVSAPVAWYNANAWGLYDLHGNVREWCWDWYADRATNKAWKPPGPYNGLLRGHCGYVVRGGSWRCGPSDTRSARRHWCQGKRTPDDVGFRLVAPLPEPKSSK